MNWTGSCEWNGQTVWTWRVEPLTGKPHQIRFHLAQKGFPILGDAKYGSQIPFRENEIALRAVKLELPNEGGGRVFEVFGL